jgi:signal transduction histidine kinase
MRYLSELIKTYAHRIGRLLLVKSKRYLLLLLHRVTAWLKKNRHTSRIITTTTEIFASTLTHIRVTALRLANLGDQKFRFCLLSVVCIVLFFQSYSLLNYKDSIISPIRSQIEDDIMSSSAVPTQKLKAISKAFEAKGVYRSVQNSNWVLLPFTTLALSLLVTGAVVTVLYRRLNKIHHNLVAITHDLKGPLSSTIGHLESIVVRSKGKLDPEILQHVMTALRSAESAGALVRDIHYVSKLETSGNVSLRERFNISDLLLDTTLSLRQRFLDKHVLLIEEIPTESIYVTGDISLIERLIRNILENALRYTGAHGSVTVCVQSLDDNVRISIRDTGCGIAPDEISKIFDDSFRGSNTKFTFEGSGVGLTVAKQIAELHGTKIAVSSQLGKGTEVSWYMPHARKEVRPIRMTTSKRVIEVR